MHVLDIVFLFALFGIGITQLYWMWLSIGAFFYSRSSQHDAARRESAKLPNGPLVTVLIPAHNEAVVIEKTLLAIAASDYAQDRFEILLINDGSTDETSSIAQAVANEMGQIRVVDVPTGEGGKGKSRTLNVGLQYAEGDVIAVFDADNTPEPDCLRRLIAALQSDPHLVAVNGKIRTRNWADGWLTRFIHLEFIFFQWIFQAGRWHWFGLSTLMGTNYVIEREALEAMGGFDEKSLVDDTEMSLRLFVGQRRIQWIPDAVSWEQEPNRLDVWFRQRTRWAQGNLYTLLKFLPHAAAAPLPIGLEMLNSILNFFLFLPALILSHFVLFASIFGLGSVQLIGPYKAMWPILFVVYVAQIWFALSNEERRLSMYFLAVLSYISYAMLFIPVVITAIFKNIRIAFGLSEFNWIKTVRSQE